MTDAPTARPVEAIAFPDFRPAKIMSVPPELRHVAPTSLLVDEAYQRALTDRSRKLILRIAEAWDWRKYKPPVVVETPDGLHIIDGQHTAIGAATHGGFATIPVMVVRAETIAERAEAFVGHNRDRLGVTALDLHFASIAAGDEDALTVAQVCQRAGVRLLRFSPSGGVFKPGDTMAVSAIAKATDALMHDKDLATDLTPEDLALHLFDKQPEVEREAKRLVLSQNLPLWKALAILYFRLRPRRRRSVA